MPALSVDSAQAVLARIGRYGADYGNPNGPINISSPIDIEWMLDEPFYQLMRQQLLASRLEQDRAEGADIVRVLLPPHHTPGLPGVTGSSRAQATGRQRRRGVERACSGTRTASDTWTQRCDSDHEWWEPLLITTEDAKAKFNRAEYLRIAPTTSLDHRRLYGMRQDAESLNAQLERAFYGQRLPAWGVQNQTTVVLLAAWRKTPGPDRSGTTRRVTSSSALPLRPPSWQLTLSPIRARRPALISGWSPRTGVVGPESATT